MDEAQVLGNAVGRFEAVLVDWQQWGELVNGVEEVANTRRDSEKALDMQKKGVSRDSERVLVREQCENIINVQPSLFVNGEMLAK